MSLAIYIKEMPSYRLQPAQKRSRLFFGLIATLGFTLITFSAWPFLAWQITTLPKLTGKIDHVPIPQAQVLAVSSTVAPDIQEVKTPDGFSYFTTTYKPQGLHPEKFSVTIPKLKIEKAAAKVDSLDFYNNLSHFPGSALPGEIGNSFITGHSGLPLIYDPKDYKTIFTKLSELKVGDDVFVEIEEKKLQFKVQYAKVVDPKDLSVLSPISSNGRNLTLMTCVPPGTNLKRLVVITSLI